jgi:Zn finger protein HypA/HybF involved in hydrogenase expression
MPKSRNKTDRTNNKYSKEWLEPIVLSSQTWADVCRKLEIKPATGAQTHIKRVAIKFNIDFSHFLGNKVNKGKKFPHLQQPIENYLNNTASISSSKLRNKLIAIGLKEYRCELCSGTEWFGHTMPLELDHKDSNHQNNNLENLQIICPNCHAIETKIRRKVYACVV